MNFAVIGSNNDQTRIQLLHCKYDERDTIEKARKYDNELKNFYFVFKMQLRKILDVEKGEDTIHIYKDGYKIEYFGVRDPETFVSWLMDVSTFLIH